MTDAIFDAVLKGDIYEIESLLKQQIKEGLKPEECLKAMMAGLEEAGKQFEAGNYFVPELVMSGDTFKAGMAVLQPLMTGPISQNSGVVVLGTVQGDVHDIGKNLVGFLLESSGFKVIDLGNDVSPDKFVQAVKEHSANVLALSALLTTTMLGMRDVMESLKKAKLKDKVKVIIGGAPVSQKFADEIGANAYAATAPQGGDIVKGWLSR